MKGVPGQEKGIPGQDESVAGQDKAVAGQNKGVDGQVGQVDGVLQNDGDGEVEITSVGQVKVPSRVITVKDFDVTITQSKTKVGNLVGERGASQSWKMEVMYMII